MGGALTAALSAAIRPRRRARSHTLPFVSRREAMWVSDVRWFTARGKQPRGPPSVRVATRREVRRKTARKPVRTSGMVATMRTLLWPAAVLGALVAQASCGDDGKATPPPTIAPFGLDSRPSNTTCLAKPRPVLDAGRYVLDA